MAKIDCRPEIKAWLFGQMSFVVGVIYEGLVRGLSLWACLGFGLAVGLLLVLGSKWVAAP